MSPHKTSSSSGSSHAESTVTWLRRTLTNRFSTVCARPPSRHESVVDGQPNLAEGSPPLPVDNVHAAVGSATPFQRFLSVVQKRPGHPEFPPPEWFEQAGGIAKGDDTEPDQLHAEATAIPLSETTTPSSSTPNDAHNASEAPPDSSLRGEDVDPPPEPSFVAGKIQSFLTTFPQIYSSSPSTPSTSAQGLTLIPANLDGDSKLFAWLSSPAVMNGTLAKGKQSVWSVLDRLRPARKDIQVSSQGESTEPATEDEELIEQSMRDDRSSVMLYGPLVPDPDGHDDGDVEIARSSTLSVDEQEAEVDESPAQTAEGSTQRGPQRRQSRIHVRKNEEKIVWLPSDTEISLELTWWGYRIYLPPPVLAILDGQHANASKQAAILATALKWILDRIPLLAIPPQFRAAFKLTRLLVPSLGYIGSFVAWSWGAIKGFDKGNGVILTATWPLPVALVPTTWEE